MMFGAPHFYQSQYRGGVLGAGWWAVNMNNHTDVATFDNRRDASIDAARRNFEEGCSPMLLRIGLDGVE